MLTKCVFNTVKENAKTCTSGGNSGGGSNHIREKLFVIRGNENYFIFRE